MLEAASLVFGERGYEGTTTDAVARAAGVSQAYIVRMFGSKQALFTEVAQRALARIEEAFRAAAADDASPTPLEERLGLAYVGLVHDRGVLRIVTHLFSLGHDPRFGPMAREGFLSIYRMLRTEIGISEGRTQMFLAQGMLVTTVLGLRLPDLVEADDDARRLLTRIFRDTFDDVVATATQQGPLPAARRCAESDD